MLGDITWSGGNLSQARAAMVTYFIKSNVVVENGENVDEAADAWEQRFLDLFACDHEEKSDTCGNSDWGDVVVYPFATRSISDRVGNQITGDLPKLSVAIVIMVIYVICNLGQMCHRVRSRVLLAFGSIVSITLGTAAAFGLCMWCQVKYTSLVQSMLFIILGIGVDDSFVIVNALDWTDPSLPVDQRMSKALSRAGMSIFVTSLTDSVAFALSVSSILPALSWFCIYAAVTIVFVFMYQVFFFAALVTFDMRRQAAQRMDCFPCVLANQLPEDLRETRTKEDETHTNAQSDGLHLSRGRLGLFLETSVGRCVTKWPVAVGLIVVCSSFFGISCWQVVGLEVHDSFSAFIGDDVYVSGTLNKVNEYFGDVGEDVTVFTTGGDYFGSQTALLDIKSRLRELDSMTELTGDDFSSWAESFRDACQAGIVSGVTSFDETTATVTDQYEYYAGLKTWLDDDGREFLGDVKWWTDDPQTGIMAARLSATAVSMLYHDGDEWTTDTNKANEAYDEITSEVKSWSDMPSGRAWAVSGRNFLDWYEFGVIKRELFQSLGLCLLAIFIITLTMIAHPVTSLCVFLSITFTIVDIVGIMRMAGYKIDSVLTVWLVIAVGLAVDYSAHIGHSFMKHDGTRQERLCKVLGEIGTAVMHGGITTFLSVLPLAFSQSYVFFLLFLTCFLTVLLGLFHGVFFLPAMLFFVGPAPYETATNESKLKLSHRVTGY
uniref:SSD domain-containing protein n=1 Tax=Noctiluca scintillans TaxID=2966 RepID=A0A7S1FIA0_NOCSC